MKRRPVEIRKSTRTFLTCSYAILLTNQSHIVVEARSWWSLEIPALDAIRNEDPLYAPSSALLMEDNSFMYGGSSGFVEDHIESSSQNFNHLTIGLPMSSNPTLGNESSYHMVEHVPNKVPSKVPSKVSTASPSVTAYGKINEDEQPTYSSPEQYDAAIGSCPPNHTLYLLWLYDLVGDGWGSTKLAIKETSAASNSEDTIFVGSLDASNRVVKYEAGKQRRGLGVTLSERILGPSGSILGLAQGFADTPPDEGISSAKGFANGLEYGKGEGNERNDGNQTSSNAQYLCLKPDVCYTAKVSGGTSLEEARWEVTRVKLLGTEVNIGSAVAEGVGTGAGVCNFSLGDSCAKTCDATAQNIEPTASPTTQRPTEALISTPKRPTSYIIPKKPYVASASSENLVQDNGSASTFVASASSKNLVQDDGSASAFVASTSSENLVQDNDSASAFVAFRSSENLVQDDDSAS